MPEQTVLNGRYELHRRVARGGMADVFLARDQLLDRPVAVKVLFPEFATDPAFVERFRREAQSAANLNHPNIVNVYDWGQQDSTYFIVMEYVEGRSLAEIIRTEGPLHPQRAAEVAADIAAALGFAHRNGVIHRDVKPGNVLISPNGQVKVTDFGIARALDAGAEQGLTQTGSVMGTATYFSPEQAQGHSLDPRSDLYSLGIVLYEMVVGRPPFTGESPVSIAYKHVQEQATPPRHINTNVPPELEAITMKLLSKAPGQRYASAEDLRADLRRFCDGKPVAAMGAAVVGATAAVAAVPPTTTVRAYDGGTQVVAATDLAPPYVPPRRNGAFLVVLIVLLLILAGLLFLLARTLTSGDGKAQTEDLTVPAALIGKPQDEALQALRLAGFDNQVVSEKNDTVDAGIVFDTSPKPGTTVSTKKGVKPVVIVRVSAGANTVKMPSVIGSQLDKAQKLLADRGFTNVTSDQQPNDNPDVAVGEVFKQSPTADSDVAKDAPIVLTVSNGPSKVEIPDVAGKTAADAANTLGQAGFKTTTISEDSTSVPGGSVIRTNPGAGTEATKGTTVQMVVSTGKVAVPSVKNLSKPGADAKLKAAGLVPDAQCSVDPTAPAEGNATDQGMNPAAGTMVETGTTVRYTVKTSDPTLCG